MDLGKKLNILSSGKADSNDIDLDLTGANRYEDLVPPRKLNEASEDEYSEDDLDLGDLSIESYLSDMGYKKKKKNKKKKSYTNFFDDIETEYVPKEQKRIDKIMETTKQLSISVGLAESADDFDNFLDDDDGYFSAEENSEMRNNLISLGRKYARDSASSKENSEITKTFVDSEKRLKALYEELDRDKGSLQKDIERMRVPGRGGKTLADLISVKNSMQSTQLSIVKEINTMRKNMYDMRQKEALRKEAETAGGSDINSNTLQSIFSSARSGLVNNMGGYSGITGSSSDDDSSMSTFSFDNEMTDEEIQKRYFRDDNSSDSDDGAKFLEYEDRGVEYILLLDDSDKVQGVIAEDRDGVMIPDYPLPNNIDELSFDIDPISKVATDNLHRNYQIRRV